MTKHNHMWTKDEIRLVRDQWETHTKNQIADMLGVNGGQVDYMVMQLRKAGCKLAIKHKKGQLSNLIKEVIAEL